MAAGDFVQALGSSGKTAASTTAVITLSVSTTAGNTLILAGRGGSGYIITGITDSKGNVWSQAAGAGANNGATVSLWYAHLSAALVAGDTITATWGGSQSGLDAVASEFQGTLTPQSPDNSGNATAASGSGPLATELSAVTSQAVATLISAIGWGTTSGVTHPASFSDPQSAGTWTEESSSGTDNVAFMYQIGSAAGLFELDWTWTGSYNANSIIVAFLAPSSVTTKSVADAGSGADTAGNLAALLALSDAAAGADAFSSLLAALAALDAGSGTEALAVLSGAITKAVSDAGLGSDALGLAATLALQEFGTGLDSVSASTIAAHITTVLARYALVEPEGRIIAVGREGRIAPVAPGNRIVEVH